MNRRSFLSAMLKGAAAFTILPGAGRLWKAERPLYRWLPNNSSGVVINSLWDIELYNRLPYYLAKTQINSERAQMMNFHEAAFENLIKQFSK